MAQLWKDDDLEDHEFDERQAGPEYWMHKSEQKRSLSRCIKCGIKQILDLRDTGVYVVCPNKRCNYRELIIDWKV